MSKRTEITQSMCDHAKILLAGGATGKVAADILGVGESTVYRMRKAGFDAEKYNENKVSRAQQKEKTEPATAEELPGQMRMELPEQKEDTKQMRFQAAMIDRLIMELDRINDTLNQFMRAMSGV